MRIGVRLAVSSLVLASTLISAAAVHLLWWRTADADSRLLVSTINQQIVAAVQKEISAIDTEARSAHAAIRTLFVQSVLDTREADKREFVFLSQLQAQPTLSWIAFGWPDGAYFAAHKLGDEQLEMTEISMVNGVLTRRIDRYLVVVGDIEFEQRNFVKTDYRVTDQAWFRSAMESDEPRWFDVSQHPDGTHAAIAFAGPIDVYQKRQGVLSIVIERVRLSRFLAQLAVGRTGAAFILGADGSTIAAPDAAADEVHPEHLADQPLLEVARMTARQVNGGGEMRTTMRGAGYAVALTPLAFPGWRLATVIPEQEFLGPIQQTTRHLALGLLALVVLAASASAWIARRVIAAPLVRVVGELGHVERFDLDRVRRHPSSLVEIENLSGAIADMARGLAAFGKYLPGDVVRMLASNSVEAKPGGSVRYMTVAFADIAGFTGLSERLGDQIVPLLGTYFDLMSREVHGASGTIDKFIGDAVMAFWGAPAPNPEHAVDACRSALACLRAVRTSGLSDDRGNPLRVRIGINSGSMLVGNIGSDLRLNYTVIGDAVNVASRLEGANKAYGTDIIIGQETREHAADRIIVRELDCLAVYGREGGIRIYELLGMRIAGDCEPNWATLYEAGLQAYRQRRFVEALDLFQRVLDVRSQDMATRIMMDRCRQLVETPPGEGWEATAAMESK
jgi:adenylate cyclase